MRLLLLLFVGGQSALAQTAVGKEEPKAMGWHYQGVYNLNFSLTSSQDVVGQTDGASQTYGTNDKAGYYHFSENTEWRNDLSLREATTKSPSLPRFLKSDDELKFDTIYLYTLPEHPKVGPYARGEAAAPIFKGEDVRSEPKVYALPSGQTVTGTSLHLTDGFKPLTTKEALGFFYKPLTEEKIKIETRLGVAGQQIKANGQYTISGTNPAGELQVNALHDVSQAGLEAAVSIKGKIDDKSAYEVSAEAMTPFVNDKAAGDNRSAWRLTNVDASAKLTSKITEWASFGYNYTLKIQPQLVDRAQQIHMVVINLSYPSNPGK